MGQFAQIVASLTNDLLRVAVGTVQIYIASSAVSQSGLLASLLDQAKSPFLTLLVSHATLPVLFAGGVMLACGFLTRIAAAVQLPIVAAGALFYFLNDFPEAQFVALGLSPILLLALLNILVSGPSKFSIDYLSGFEDGEVFPDDSDTDTKSTNILKEVVDEDPIECARRLAW